MLKKSNFARNIVQIAAGSAFSQLILIGSTPVLTRLYDPSEFGALALFSSAYAFIVGLFTLKYDYAIILPEDDGVARELTTLCLCLALAMGIVGIAGLAAAKYGFGQELAWYFFLVPVASVLGTAYTCAQQWAARARNYRRSSQSQVVNAVTNVGVVLALAASGWTFTGRLVVGYTLGLSAATVFLAGHGWRHGRFASVRTLVARAREFKRFPLFVLPTFLLATGSANTAPFVLRALFRIEEVGFYAVANRFLLAPSSLVGGAISEAFRAEFVSLHKLGGDTSRLFQKTLRTLLLVAVPVFGALMVLAPTLFEFLLGASFAPSGLVVRYISVGVCAQFVAQPFQYVFVATGRVRTGLVVQGACAFVPLLGLVAGGLKGAGMLQSLLYGALLSAVTSSVMIWMAYRCCESPAGLTDEVSNHA
jgi:O-antigen/teichoic acid export membrane protein